MDIKGLVNYIRDYGVDGTALHPNNKAVAKQHDKKLHDLMVKVEGAQDEVLAHIASRSNPTQG